MVSPTHIQRATFLWCISCIYMVNSTVIIVAGKCIHFAADRCRALPEKPHGQMRTTDSILSKKDYILDELNHKTQRNNGPDLSMVCAC